MPLIKATVLVLVLFVVSGFSGCASSGSAFVEGMAEGVNRQFDEARANAQVSQASLVRSSPAVESRNASGAGASQTCQAAFADPAIDPIRGKITIDVKDISAAMRNDPRYAAPQDKPALQAWLRARRQCENPSALFPGNPRLAASYEAVLRRTDELIWELIEGRMTYGQFNTNRIDNVQQGARERAGM